MLAPSLPARSRSGQYLRDAVLAPARIPALAARLPRLQRPPVLRESLDARIQCAKRDRPKQVCPKSGERRVGTTLESRFFSALLQPADSRPCAVRLRVVRAENHLDRQGSCHKQCTETPTQPAPSLRG